MFDHDDSVNDRSDGSKLNNSTEITAMLWKGTFGEEYKRKGCRICELLIDMISSLIITRLYVQRNALQGSTVALIRRCSEVIDYRQEGGPRNIKDQVEIQELESTELDENKDCDYVCNLRKILGNPEYCF